MLTHLASADRLTVRLYGGDGFERARRVARAVDEINRRHDKLLIVLSEHSVASPWVSDEVEAAMGREHREGRTVLFPIKIDDAVMESKQAWAAIIRRTRHIGDFTCWKDRDSYQKAFDRLLRDLKAEDRRATGGQDGYNFKGG